MPLSLHKHFFDDFSHLLFIRLFRDDFFDDFHHFVLSLFFCMFYIAQQSETHYLFLCLSSFAPTIHIHILGVAKDTWYCVSTSTLKTMIGVTPSMRVFGLGSRRLRFDASGSRLDVTSRVSGVYCLCRLCRGLPLLLRLQMCGAPGTSR